MARRASIEIDLGIGIAPDRWTASWVQDRTVEAYMIERKLPGARRNGTGSAWPAITYEFSDVVGWPDARERVLDDWARTSGGAFAAEISRMDQAHEWLRLYLTNHEIERVCLSSWATTVAHHRSISRMLARKQWSRSTFYRYVNEGAHIIAMALDAKGEPVSQLKGDVMTEQRRGEELSDAEVERIRCVTWPACVAILDAAIEKMQAEMEHAVYTDNAFNSVTVMLLNEVFMRQTILAAAGRLPEDDVMDWIEKEFDAWDNEEGEPVS